MAKRFSELQTVTRLFCVFGILALVVLGGQGQTMRADHRVAGHIRDVCGRVLPGTVVTLANKSGVTLNATTDGEGRYALVPPSEPGPWTLSAKLVGYLPAVTENVVLSSVTSTETNIRLLTDPSNVRTTTISVSDRSPDAAPIYPHELIGTVSRASAPAQGALVTLTKSARLVERCECDELGRYEFWVTDAGPWTLMAELPGFDTYRRSDVLLVPRQRVTIDIALSRARPAR